MESWRDKKPVFVDFIHGYQWYESVLDEFEYMIENMKRCSNCKNKSSYGGCRFIPYDEMHDDCRNGKYKLWELR